MARYRGNSHDYSREASKLGGLPVTVCDYSGFMFDKSNTVQQLQYNGSGLYNTGYVVGSKFHDTPNPQALTPPIKLDPQPVLGVIFDSQGLGPALKDATVIDIKNYTGQDQNPLLINSWEPTASFVFVDSESGLQSFEVQFINTIFQMYFSNQTNISVTISIQGHPFMKYSVEPGALVCLSYNMIEFKTIL